MGGLFFKTIITSLIAGAAYVIGQILVAKHEPEIKKIIDELENQAALYFKEIVGEKEPDNYAECLKFLKSKNCTDIWDAEKKSCLKADNFSGKGVFQEKDNCYIGSFVGGKKNQGLIYFGNNTKDFIREGRLISESLPKLPDNTIINKMTVDNYDSCKKLLNNKSCSTSMIWNIEKEVCNPKDNFSEKGVFLDAYDSCYVGQFKMGKYHAQGILYYPSQEKYEGNFVNGKRHGLGKLINKNQTISGQWKDDKLSK